MKEAALEAIKEIVARKEKEGIAPTHATKLELQQALFNALNELYQEGKIKVGNTINDKWIVINE